MSILARERYEHERSLQQKGLSMKIKLSPKTGAVRVELRPEEAQIPAQSIATDPIFKLQKILVPVDFSDCSNKAVEYAIAFAKQFGSELFLLHVVEPHPVVPEMGQYDPDMIHDRRADLAALQKSIGRPVRSTASLRTGTPHMEIAGAAEDLGIDLVIIATHGRKGLSRVVLGSTTEKVVRHAPCPVLIVRETEREFLSNRCCTSAAK